MNCCALMLFAAVGILPFTAYTQVSELPLTLSMPFDGDTIEEDEPVFVWQADLLAIQTDPRLSQRIAVVQLQYDQTPLDAMAVNAPVFIREDVTSSSLSYSATDHELEMDTWYAWQVSYLMNGLVIGQSEVWKFIKATPPVPKRNYVALRRQNDASVYHPGAVELCVSTTEKGTLSLNAVVIKPNGQRSFVQLQEVINDELQEASVSQPSTETRYFILNTESFEEEGLYTFEWNGNRKHTFTINFIKE